MGICCTGKLTKSEYRHDDIRIHLRTGVAPHPKQDPKFSIDTEKTNLNTLINSLITEYLQINLKYKLSKLNIDQLYNISLQYKHDFTSCPYIICDLRVNAVPHNFLSKFKQINYTLHELQLLSPHKRSSLRTYLHSKSLIFLLSEASLEQCQQYISFFESESIELSCIIIVDSSLHEDNAHSDMMLLMFYLNDWRVVEHIPSILLSLKYFPHMSSSRYVFLQRRNDVFTYEFLGNVEEDNGMYNQFCSDFNIANVLKLNKGVFTSIQMKEFKRRSRNANWGGQCFVSEMEIDVFDREEVMENKSSILNIMARFRNAIVENEECLLIQVDDDIEKEVLYRFVYLLINYITNVPCCKINEYLLMNKCELFLAENDYYKQHCAELEDIINICKE